MSSLINKPGFHNVNTSETDHGEAGQGETGQEEAGRGETGQGETCQGETTLPDQDVVDTRCGFWMCKPTLLQPCAKVGVFTGFFSCVALVTTSLTVYVNSQVTTLERQFGFSSHQTGIILAANDIGYLACVLFMGYFASRIHIPRSLGLATIAFGLSGLSCSLPHFLFGATANVDPTAHNTNSTAVVGRGKMSPVFGLLCDVFNITDDRCELAAAQRAAQPAFMASQDVASVSLIIIVIGMSLQGFGKAPRLLFTVPYLDDNTAKVNTGLYLGIITAMAVLGPACAFLLGGVFNEIYVTLEDTELTPRHPKWIGAWWLGYVVFGTLSLIISVPLFCFPQKLPRKKSGKKDAESIPPKGELCVSDVASTNKPSTKPGSEQSEAKLDLQETPAVKGLSVKFLLRHSREFFASIHRLLMNPLYVIMVTAHCLTIFAVSGSMAYTPKYMESMFHLPARRANFIMALQTLCTSCVGTFIGGYLTKRLKMTGMTALKYSMIVSGIATATKVLGLVFYCEQPAVQNLPSDVITCNNGCNCEDNSYFPICGEDGRTYYSPCHAGCGHVEQGVYFNCSCIPDGQAIAGTCAYGCYHLYTYIVAMGVTMIFGTQSIVPKLIVLIRCVSLQDRSMALAVSSFMVSLLGWLLGPVIFGNIIDSTCTIWDINCGSRGRCLLYDNREFRLQLYGYCTIGLGCATTCYFLGYVYARWSKCLGEANVKAGGTQNGREITLVFSKSDTPVREEGISSHYKEKISVEQLRNSSEQTEKVLDSRIAETLSKVEAGKS